MSTSMYLAPEIRFTPVPECRLLRIHIDGRFTLELRTEEAEVFANDLRKALSELNRPQYAAQESPAI